MANGRPEIIKVDVDRREQLSIPPEDRGWYSMREVAEIAGCSSDRVKRVITSYEEVAQVQLELDKRIGRVIPTDVMKVLVYTIHTVDKETGVTSVAEAINRALTLEEETLDQEVNLRVQRLVETVPAQSEELVREMLKFMDGIMGSLAVLEDRTFESNRSTGILNFRFSKLEAEVKRSQIIQRYLMFLGGVGLGVVLGVWL